MDKKLAKRVLHDLEVIKNEYNDLNIETKVFITGKDIGKLQEPYILTSFYGITLRDMCKELDYLDIAFEATKGLMEYIIEKNK